MDNELHVAVEAARKAALCIREIYDAQDFTVVEKTRDRGPLTEADLKANRILLSTLREHFPEDGILSEESRDDGSRLDKPRVWIVDPLDGTREFTLGTPEFVVSIGLVQGGEPILGVLCNPVTGELFAGVVGRGLHYNGQVAHVTSHGEVRGGRFLVSRSEHAKGWFERWEGEAEMKPVGSVAYKIGLVAAGKAEATFTPKPRNEWDLAGGVACLLAAGGQATDGRGQPYRFNRPDPLHQGVVCTNGAIHDAVLAMMHRQV